MARVLRVSRSGYYKWLRASRVRAEARRKKEAFDKKVKALFFKKKERYGAPRLQKELAKSGDHFDEKTIAKSMQRQGLVAKAGRKFKATTNSKHSLPVAPNILKQNFTVGGPDSAWVADITYCATTEGWTYLAVVVDLFSRKVVGWSMSDRMTKDLVLEAMRMAIIRREKPKNVIWHSDRGSQYCSKAYANLAKKYQCTLSMSGKGNCYDNACAESFFHTLKVELLHGEVFSSRKELRETVFECIECDYNRTRLHSFLGYMSPEEFEVAESKRA